MEELNNDIFNHIKEVLRNHEEPYDEGAWERFKAAQPAPTITVPVKRPIKRLWKWTAAAAAIAGILLFARIYYYSVDSTPLQPENDVVTTSPFSDTTSTHVAISSDAPTSPDSNLATSDFTHLSSSVATPKLHTSIAHTQFTTTPSIDLQSKEDDITIISNKPITPLSYEMDQKESKPNNNNVDFWKHKSIPNNPENTIPQQHKPLLATASDNKEKHQSEKGKKWQPSLYVSPVFGDQGIDIGYGVAVGYAINDKIRISSGIAHTKISSSRSFDKETSLLSSTPAPMASSESASFKTYSFVLPQETATLQQVQGSLSGIDIPVEINYNFNKKIYASAGVSGLVVLDDKKTYTYDDSHNIKVSVETSKGALKEDKSITFNEFNTSSSPIQAPTENTSFLGFYNLSVGYRQKISGKNAVSIEPFIKIPMKQVTQQNLNYQGTGIRLKFDF